MTAETFVNELILLKPRQEDLMNLGFDMKQTKEIIGSYICLKREKENINTPVLNSLFTLIQKYDCSNVEIGLVHFSIKISEEIDFYKFGHVEADILALNKITQEVEVREWGSLHTILWKCASNGNNFLASLLLCADLFSMRIKNPSLSENIDFTYERVRICSETAGGDKYLNFYKMLLGYFD